MSRDATATLFVYGSLMTGYGNNRLLQGSRSLGRAFTRDAAFAMCHAGVPFVRAVPPSVGVRIAGEVFAVTDAAVLAAVDRLEGHPDWYARTEVDVTLDATGERIRGGMYVNPLVSDRPGEGLVIDDAAPVPSGDFRDVAPPLTPAAAPPPLSAAENNG